MSKESKLWISLAVSHLIGTLAIAQLDNTDVLLGVYLESGMIVGERERAEELVLRAAEETSAAMEKGSLELKFLNRIEDGIAEDVGGILSITNCALLHKASEAIAAAGKLHLAITSGGCWRIQHNSTFTVPMTSDRTEMVQLIADMRERNLLTWDDIVVIHDDSIEAQNMDLLLPILNHQTDMSNWSSLLVADISDDGKRLWSLLEDLGSQPGEPKRRQFLAIVSRRKVEMIQKTASSLKLTGPSFQWLFVIPDTHSLNFDVTEFLGDMKDGDNLAFACSKSTRILEIKCKISYECYLDSLIRQFGIEYSNALKMELDAFSKMSELETWEDIKPSSRQRAVAVVNAIKTRELQSASCGICSEWGIVAAETRSADRFALIEVANWKPMAGLDTLDDLFPHVTGGFRNRTIVVASIDFPPWQISKPDGHWNGLIFDLLDELGRRLNFTYVVRTPPDNKWGTKDADGKWNGMIRMIMDHEVLVGAAAFTVSQDRLTAVNFSRTIDRQPYTFMVARPKELSRVLIFVEPFANDTWLLTALLVLFIGPVLYFFQRTTPYYDHYGLNDGIGFFELKYCSWYLFGAILQQDGNKLPFAHSARIVVAFWWIFVIVMTTTYCGNLVAFLTFPQVGKAVSTLDELLAQRDDMAWGYVGGTVLEEYFKSAEGKFGEIGEGADVRERKDEGLLDRVRKSGYALIDWKVDLLFAMKKEFLRTDTCDFSLGVEEFYFENVALPFPADSPYVDLFNEQIKNFQISGLIEKWKNDNWPRKDKCSSTAYDPNISIRTVSVSDMQGSFFVLFMGGALAAFIMVVELALVKILRNLSPSTKKARTIVESFFG